MTPETQATISVALSQMYDKGIDHAIDICKDHFIASATIEAKAINVELTHIIDQLENLKAKG